MSDLPARLMVRPDEIAAKVIDDEAIIINLSSGVYYSMQGVGGRIWSLIEQEYRVNEIVDILLAEFDVPADHCRTDVEGLCRQLLEEELVITSENGTSPDAPSGDRPAADRTWTAPVLNIYRDMGDLLALDPPVPGLEPIPWEDPTRGTSSDTD